MRGSSGSGGQRGTVHTPHGSPQLALPQSIAQTFPHANHGSAEANVIWAIKTRWHIRPYHMKGLFVTQVVWEPLSGRTPATGNVKIKLDVTNWFQALLSSAAAAPLRLGGASPEQAICNARCHGPRHHASSGAARHLRTLRRPRWGQTKIVLRPLTTSLALTPHNSPPLPFPPLPFPR